MCVFFFGLYFFGFVSQEGGTKGGTQMRVVVDTNNNKTN